MEIIFSRSNSLISKIIRYFDKGKWSHVAIKLDDYHVLDARFPRGVQIRHFDMEEYEVIKVDGDVSQALNHIGQRYDLLRFFWHGIKYGDKVWNNPNQFLCSELISEAVHDEQLKGLTPNEQYQYLIKHKINK